MSALVAAAAAQKALKDAEALMTAYEVATHRIFVALLHSEYLHKRPTLQQQWMEALDGLGGFVDLVPSNYQGATSQELGEHCTLCPSLAASSALISANSAVHCKAFRT